MTNSTIQVRTDNEVKMTADSIFNKLGITMSDGINIFLRQVNLHGGFPFDVKLSNSFQNTLNKTQKRENIQNLCGKYKEAVFSSKRYFEQKQLEKEKEK